MKKNKNKNNNNNNNTTTNNLLAVLGKVDRGAVVELDVDAHILFLSVKKSRGSPKANGAIGAGGDQMLAVGSEADVVDGFLVALQCCCQQRSASLMSFLRHLFAMVLLLLLLVAGDRERNEQ